MCRNLRRAGLAATLVVATACGFKRFPQRRPGSDVALPPSNRDWLVEALVGCGNAVLNKGPTGARDVAVCRKATGDTVPDPKQPVIPPPTSVP